MIVLSRGKMPYFVILTILSLLSWPSPGNGQISGQSIGERFSGEVLKYDFGFWIFKRAGEGFLTFQALGNGQYLAHHEGKTLGIVGWATRYRRDTYRSIMKMDREGRRFLPLRLEEEVVIGSSLRQRITEFDYFRGKIFTEDRRGGEVEREAVDIPDGVFYEEPLTAFYNLRFGVYGKIKAGERYSIVTVPRAGRSKVIHLEVISEETGGGAWRVGNGNGQRILRIQARMDKELVGSLQGALEGWFTEDMIPLGGVAKDLFFFADLVGRITHREFRDGPARIAGVR